MRKFVTSCIDEKTGYEMVLSEASYNEAMYWLQRDIEKSIYPREIYRTEDNGTDDNGIDDMWIFVGIPKKGINPMTGYEDVWYTNTVIFHYDESRGYLMKE